jgi:hypothetical protein
MIDKFDQSIRQSHAEDLVFQLWQSQQLIKPVCKKSDRMEHKEYMSKPK